MSMYRGQICPVCNRRFVDDEDIVVCPDCGAPHHRECYKDNGACAHIESHDKKYEWHAAAPEPLPVSCKNCNATNMPGIEFCEKCGASLLEYEPIEDKEEFKESEQIPFFTMFTNMINMSSNDHIDGIKVKDWLTYIGTAAPSYLFAFKRMDETKRKVSFSISALFFGPLYFLYRKMWLWGVLSFLLQAVLSIPSSIVLLETLYGIVIPIESGTFNVLYYICNILLFATNLAWSFFALYLYRKTAGKAIKKIRAASASQEEFEETLNRRSGPCMPVVFVVFALVLVTIFI